jgi:hypothetical protein
VCLDILRGASQLAQPYAAHLSWLLQEEGREQERALVGGGARGLPAGGRGRGARPGLSPARGRLAGEQRKLKAPRHARFRLKARGKSGDFVKWVWGRVRVEVCMCASFARRRRPQGEGLTHVVPYLNVRRVPPFPLGRSTSLLASPCDELTGPPFSLAASYVLLSVSQNDSPLQAAEPVASLMEIDGGGEGAEAGVSRSATAAEALPSPSPSPSPPSKRTRVAAPAAPQAQGQDQDQEQASADRALATTTSTSTSMRGRSRAAVVLSR